MFKLVWRTSFRSPFSPFSSSCGLCHPAYSSLAVLQTLGQFSHLGLTFSHRNAGITDVCCCIQCLSVDSGISAGFQARAAAFFPAEPSRGPLSHISQKGGSWQGWVGWALTSFLHLKRPVCSVCVHILFPVCICMQNIPSLEELSWIRVHLVMSCPYDHIF